ncbi:MAG TPA: phosphatidylglycerophosphatase A [Usitatibacter sp.]|nr:phosphatidylglycerophosphatase A [Usitatibacter sp.]
MAADSTTSRRPDLRFLLAHPAHLVALGFGVGLAPVAPGTFGTLASVGLYWALASFLTPLAIAFSAIPLFFVGVWACEVTGRDLGDADHGAMVWDEIVAFLPLAAISSASWWLQAIAFALFRAFDILKPPPIRSLERHVKGGMGVMIDDAVAGFYAYLTFALFIVVVYKGFGYAG